MFKPIGDTSLPISGHNNLYTAGYPHGRHGTEWGSGEELLTSQAIELVPPTPS